MKMTKNNKLLLIIVLPVAVILGFMIGTSSALLTILILLALMGFVAWVLLGNKQGAKADDATIADALSMKVPADKARIYVMRKGFAAGMQGMDIKIGDAFTGQIRSKFFLMAELEPGTYVVSAKMSKQGDTTMRAHEVTLGAGELALLDISLEMGVTKMTPLFEELKDKSAAREKLEGMTMVSWL